MRRLLLYPQPLRWPSTVSSRSLSSPAMPRQPRKFPSSGFETIDPSQRVEEERLRLYGSQDYYPMRIGQVVQGRYQVVAKLGYGTSSTVWLSRHLGDDKFWALKVHVNTLKHNQELDVYRHINAAAITAEHPGREYVRQCHDSFQLKGPHGEHQVFVMTPLGMSLRTLQDMQNDGVFQSTLVTRALDQILLGLDFLREAHVTHTGHEQDLHSDNLLVALTDDSVLSTVEDNEMHNPSARKRAGDGFVHVSHCLLGGAGPLTICDLGQARIGSEHRGNAMPTPYRAPEVILGMPWGNAVDVWSVGLLAWDLLHRESLFHVYDRESEERNDAHHLAAMTALLGPPPPEFLSRSRETSRYWDESGQWHGPVALPHGTKLESLASTLVGEDGELFLGFCQCLLSWLPEERLTSIQAYFHPWLRGKGA